MKPVPNWDSVGRGYRFKEPTFYSAAHLGLDVMCPTGTPVYAPFTGTVTSNPFPEGGNVIDFRANGYVFRMLHLSKIVRTGAVNEGDLIGYTGNTGTLSTGPHLHIDISKGSVQIYNINNFVDPETFNWGGGLMASAEYNELVNRLNIDESARRFEQGRTDSLVVQMRGVQDNLTAINASLKALASSEALQDTKIQSAITSALEAAKATQGASPLSVEDKLAVSWLSKVLKIVSGFLPFGK